MCHKRPGHMRGFLPRPTDIQSDLGITRLERIRLITCASGGDSEELFKMCVSGEGQQWLQTMHHLLVARLKLKLRRNWTERTNQRLGYNTFLLNDTNKPEEFSITLSNKFQVLQELMEEETIDERWQRVKGAVKYTCKEVLGPRTATTRADFHRDRLRKGKQRRQLLTTAEHELQKLRRERNTKE